MGPPAVETIPSDHSAKPRGLVASVVSDAQRLVSLEIALAKQELRELATGHRWTFNLPPAVGSFER